MVCRERLGCTRLTCPIHMQPVSITKLHRCRGPSADWVHGPPRLSWADRGLQASTPLWGSLSSREGLAVGSLCGLAGGDTDVVQPTDDDVDVVWFTDDGAEVVWPTGGGVDVVKPAGSAVGMAWPQVVVRA